MTPQTVKVLCDMGEKGEQVRNIVLNNSEDVDMLALELEGALPYMGEFLTTDNEIITSGQIVSKA